MFPFKLTMSLEDALRISGELLNVMTEDLELPLWHALTGHPGTKDGHVTLWLSLATSEYILEHDWVSAVEESVWKPEVLDRRVENAADRGNPKKELKERKERNRKVDGLGNYEDDGMYDEDD
jgi:hypothetical protein